MSIDLTVASPINGTPQAILDQNNNTSCLSIGTIGAVIKGQDVVGGSLPMQVVGQKPTTGQTWGRLLRLTGINGTFFDIGVDDSGNLFVNTPSSTQTAHALTISPSGVVTIGSLTLPNLTPPSGGSTDVVVDSTGVVHKQG
jgi:hypothetical protein